MPRRLILLGDSIFDNQAYVGPGGRDVAAHLRAQLSPAEWRVELWAVDGSTVADVPAQLAVARLEPSAVVVLSAGGNDAIGHPHLLSDPSSTSFAETLLRLHAIREDFRAGYAAMLDRVMESGQPLIICTIYNPRFPDALLQQAAEAALSVFNDVILQEALRRRLPVTSPPSWVRRSGESD